MVSCQQLFPLVVTSSQILTTNKRGKVASRCSRIKRESTKCLIVVKNEKGKQCENWHFKCALTVSQTGGSPHTTQGQLDFKGYTTEQLLTHNKINQKKSTTYFIQ